MEAPTQVHDHSKIMHKANLAIMICKLHHISLSSQLAMWTFNFGYDIRNIILKIC